MSSLEIADSLTRDADKQRNNGHGEEAASKYLQAAEIYRQAGEREKDAAAIHMAGVSFKVDNNIPEALRLYEQASAIYRELGSPFGIGRVMTDEGISYAYAGDFQKAVEVLHQAVAELEKQEDLNALGIAQAKLGHNYWRVGNLAEADKWFEEGLRNIRKGGSWFFEMTALFNWAEMDFAEKRFGVGLEKLETALRLIYDAKEEEGQERRIAQIKGLMASCYLELGDVNRAVGNFKTALGFLGRMKPETAGVVYGDIHAKEFLAKIKSTAPEIAQTIEVPENLT